MIGIVLITHGAFGEALIQNACHVFGKRPEQLMQLGLCGGDDPEEIKGLAAQYIHWVDSGDGVLLMTDIFGASPANLAVSLRDSGRIEVIAGLNLPMLLRAITYRTQDNLLSLVEKLVEGGRASITRLIG